MSSPTTSSTQVEMAINPRRVTPGRWFDIGVAMLFGAIAIWHLLPAIEQTPFHRDEARWIHRGYRLREWQDPFSDRWQDGGYAVGEGSWDERHRMRDQPPLAPYVLGLGLLAQGHDLDTNGFWVMDRDDVWNETIGNRPSTSDLHAARRVDLVLAAATVAFIYLLTTRLSTRLGGIVAGLYLTFNPLFLDTASRAWSDPLLGLLLVLATGIALRVGQRPSWQWTIALGVALGLGGATKLSPFLLAVGLGGVGLLALIPSRWTKGFAPVEATLTRRLILIPPIAILTFIAVYPYFWTNPVGHVYRMFAFRADSFESQARGFPGAAVDSPLDAMRRILDTQAWFGTSRYVVDQMNLPAPFTPGLALGIDDLDVLIALAGAAILIRHVRHAGVLSGPGLVALLLAGQLALIVLTMGVDYPRYHLPITLTVALLIGVAAGAAADFLKHASTSRMHWTSPFPRSSKPRRDFVG